MWYIYFWCLCLSRDHLFLSRKLFEWVFCVTPFSKTLHNLEEVSSSLPLTSIVQSICRIYHLQVKCSGIWKFLHRELVNSLFFYFGGLYYFLFLDIIINWSSSFTLINSQVNWMRRMVKMYMETLSISWVVAEKLRSCGITWIYQFFCYTFFIFLLTSFLFLMQTEYSLINFDVIVPRQSLHFFLTAKKC